MSVQEVVPGLWQVKIRYVHAFLVATDDGLTLIDTGLESEAPTIVEALASIGKTPADVNRILVTHCHSDHSGGLAELKGLTGAEAWMHPADAAMVGRGESLRPLKPAPGLINAILCRFFLPRAPVAVKPAAIEHELHDGEILPGGLRAIHVPGHCAGQVAFLWKNHGGVLVAADVAANVFGLSLSPMYEDLAAGEASLRKLAALDFEVACFGHGKPIISKASAKFRENWG